MDDETEIPDDDLTILKVVPEDQMLRSGSLSDDPARYPVKLVLSRTATRTEADYLKEQLGGRIDVERDLVMIHDTTIEEIQANSSNIAQRVREASQEARRADRERAADIRERAEKAEAEHQRRLSIADEIKFE